MKKITKAISIILAVILLISVMPLSGMITLAADKVNVKTISVTVNKGLLPADGDDCVVSGDFITVAKGEVYEKDSLGTWYDDVKDPGNQSFTGVRWYTINNYSESVGYKFESGKSYHYCISFRIKSEFSSTHTFPKDGIKFEFKNLASSEYEVYAINTRGANVYVILKFKAPGERTYNDIETVHAKVYGPNSTQSDTLPPYCNKTSPWISSFYANYEFSYEWQGEFSVDAGNDKRFKSGNTYKLILTYTAKKGYKFSPDCEFFFADNNTYVKDTSITAKPESVSIKDNRTKCVVTFEFFISDYEYINTITLENKAGASLLPNLSYLLKNLSNNISVNNAQAYEFSRTIDFYEDCVWCDDKDKKIVYAPINGLCYFTVTYVTEDSDIYRFDNKLNFEIEGINTDEFWTEYELKEDNKVLTVTYYFISDYHSETRKVGRNPDNPLYCTSFKSLKFALESDEIEYIKLENVDEVLPMRKYKNAAEVEAKRSPAINVNGKKDLNIEGENYLKTNQVDTTAYFPYDDFIYINSDSALNIWGDGKLNFGFGQPNYPSAIIFNKGALNVDGVTLYADASDVNVMPQVINNKGKMNIYGGNFNSKNRFSLENGTVILNYGSETYIDGGVFNATNGNGGVGTNYGLIINSENLSLEINRGYFKSCGGIKLPNETVYLSEYAPAATHRAYVDGFRKETYDLKQENLIVDTKVVELVREFRVNIDVPASGKYPSDTDKYVLAGEPTWYCDYEKMDIKNETFQKGCEYKVDITLKTVTEKFSYREPEKAKLKAYVNGKTAETYNSVDNSNTIVITYEFGTCNDAITKIQLEGLTAPSENATPDNYVSVVSSDSSLYQVVSGSIKWYKWTDNINDAVPMESGEKFVSDKYCYYAQVKVQTRGTNIFNINEWGYANMDAYIDGYSAQTCEVYETSNRVSYKYVILEQYFGTCVNTMIEDIYLWNVEEPWAGELPSYTLDFNREQFKEQKSEGAYDENWITGTMSERWYYGKNGVRWYDITASRFIYEFEPFIEGHEYKIIINLEVIPDNEFYCDKYGDSFVNVYINGYEADVNWQSTMFNHIIEKTFICKSAVDIYDITGDGAFDVRDIVRSKRIAASVTDSFYINPDFDENGSVDSWDLVTLKKALFRYKKG